MMDIFKVCLVKHLGQRKLSAPSPLPPRPDPLPTVVAEVVVVVVVVVGPGGLSPGPLAMEAEKSSQPRRWADAALSSAVPRLLHTVTNHRAENTTKSTASQLRSRS